MLTQRPRLLTIWTFLYRPEQHQGPEQEALQQAYVKYIKENFKFKPHIVTRFKNSMTSANLSDTYLCKVGIVAGESISCCKNPSLIRYFVAIALKSDFMAGLAYT